MAVRKEAIRREAAADAKKRRDVASLEEQVAVARDARCQADGHAIEAEAREAEAVARLAGARHGPS